MKRFHFRLEAVLKHRRMKEDTALQAFAEVQQEMAACKELLRGLHEEYSRTASTRPAVIQVDELAIRERYLDSLTERIESQERVREGIAARLEDARLALVAARTACQAIERIRQSDLAAYMKEAAREEQKILDEIGSARHQRHGA